MIGFRGSVIRVGMIKPLFIQMDFVCNSCETRQIVQFSDGKFQLPLKCEGLQCKSKIFTPVKDSKDTIIVDNQRIR
jgi:DNA replicative helicase MCM subunit Mcm2 (Cdc46/Mcm family)